MTGLIRFHRSPLAAASLARNGGGFDRLFDSVASELFGDVAAADGALRADVRENANAYVITLDVPGVAKDAITVDVDEKSVRIEATAKNDVPEGETAHVSERATGSLSRVFRLSQAVDANAATATHEHGVLTLTLPKKNASAQKRLTIN
jgi:HSP20 family protein